jgi:hypothetical protein
MPLRDRLSPKHPVRVAVSQARRKEINFNRSAMDETVALLVRLHAAIEVNPVEGGDE